MPPGAGSRPQPDPQLWVVAGCLFEIVLPAPGAGPSWRWVPRPEVTLLADELRAPFHRLRFRAEAAGADAGEVQLRFEDAAQATCAVLVRIAPEGLPAL